MAQERGESRREIESRVVERRWQATLAKWKRSGQDERVFCRRQKLGLCSFRWWRSRLESKGTPSAAVPADSTLLGTGAQKWARLIARWRESGLNQVEFCREHGLAVYTLRWWKWRLGGGVPGSRGSPSARAAPDPQTSLPAFVPVQIVSPDEGPRVPPPRSTIDVLVRGRRRVRVGADFDARLLARLVAVLEAIP